MFADAFWQCYNTLQAAATDEVGMPGYFRFLTLLSEHMTLGLQCFPARVLLLFSLVCFLLKQCLP
jgi:hypothetical protein